MTRLSTAEKLALVTTGIGVLHHADHVLRVNHSGWPFRPEVNLPGVSSAPLGALAVTITILLSVSALGVLVALVRSGGR